MRGDKACGIQIDETPYLNWAAIRRVLYPMTADLGGWRTYAGTPRGQDEFAELYRKGQTGEEPGLKSWHYTSYDGPRFQTAEGREELEQLKRELPDVEFRQECLAEITANAAAAFRHSDIVLATRGETASDSGDEQCAVGYDVGKMQDPPALTVLTESGRVLRSETLPHGESYADQARFLAQVRVSYPGVCIVDTTGGGAGGKAPTDPSDTIEQFYKHVPDLISYTFNRASKERIVEGLCVDLQDEVLSIPRECDGLLRQLGNYEYAKKSGYYLFGCPDDNDHEVSALLMANWARRTGRIPERGGIVAANLFGGRGR
jgi:hypothetical protein